MKWLSIDPAKGTSGVAMWRDATLVNSLAIRPRGTKGLFYVGGHVCGSMLSAWQYIVVQAERDAPVVMEKGAGGRSNIVNAQGWIRGYIAAMCELRGCRPVEIGVSEWRRIIKEQCGVSWPADRDRKKALAVVLVQRLYGIEVTDDEADAILVGHAALACGMVK